MRPRSPYRLGLGALLCAVSLTACSVDFDGYTFDDDLLAEEEAKDKPPEGVSGRCIDFCDSQEETCGFGNSFTYASKDECFTLCEGYFDAELECRETHLDFATNDAETHCPHTIEDGGAGVCPDARPTSCDRFCLRAGQACEFDDGEAGVYPNFGACRDACDAFGEDGLECRFVELGKAEEGDASKCANLLTDGGAACADD